MRNGLGRRQIGIARHGKQGRHAGCRGTDDHDFVGVLGGRNFSVQNIVERIHWKSGFSVLRFVKLRQHECPCIRFYLELSHLNRVTRVLLDVLSLQIETFDGGKKCHRWYRLTVITYQQWFLPHGTIDVLKLVEMRDASGRFAQLPNRLQAAARGQGKSGNLV